jgi:SAM-dependent methyltransferase
MTAPRWFTRADGVRLEIVPGFRGRVLSMPRTPVRPTLEWTDEDFRAAAKEKVRRVKRLLRQVRQRGLKLEGARVLDVGCGPAIDSLLVAALAPGVEVVGIDLDLPLRNNDQNGRMLRHLAREALAEVGLEGDIDAAMARLPVRTEAMDATAMSFGDATFDFCWSEAALEHITPLDTCFAEMSRVLRPGALAYHKVDPYYWLKGCHRKGLVDMPWAHARLDVEGVVEVAALAHGRWHARRSRDRLMELNHLTPAGWRKVAESSGFEIDDWRVVRSEFAEQLLAEFPEVEETLLPGVGHDDLVQGTVAFWLRRP